MGNMKFNETKDLVLFLPSVLRTWMKIDCFKADSMMLMKHCISVDEEKKRNRKVTISDAQLLTEIMESFLAIGEATNMVFDSEFSIEAGPKIAKGRDVLFRILRPYFVDRPNMHNGLHYEAQGDTSGNIRNGRVGAKETAHKRARGVSIKSNNHLPERFHILRESLLYFAQLVGW